MKLEVRVRVLLKKIKKIQYTIGIRGHGDKRQEEMKVGWEMEQRRRQARRSRWADCG